MRKVAAIAFCAALSGCDSSIAFDEISTKSDAVDTSDDNLLGEYLCTVAERSSIESSHLEGSGPPAVPREPIFGSKPPTRFRIGVSRAEGQLLRLVELPYSGADRDQTEWHTPNSIIHSPYSGHGGSFSSTIGGSEAFFVLTPTVHSNADGNFGFYHSGFAWAGGEDAVLSIRWGRCKKT